MLNVFALAGVLLAATAGYAPPKFMPPNPVRLLSLEGMPPDSASRAEIEAGFRAEFAAEDLPIEGPAGADLHNAFRLTDKESEGVWTLQVILGLPRVVKPDRSGGVVPGSLTQKGYASRGITLAVVALSPEAIAAGARAMPTRFGVVFPIDPAPKSSYAQIPRGGYPLPWSDVGRASARLALEVLHRQAEILPEGAKLSLAPALRGSARPESSP